MKISLVGLRSGRDAVAKGSMESRVSFDEQKSTMKLLGMTLTEASLEGERGENWAPAAGSWSLWPSGTRTPTGEG